MSMISELLKDLSSLQTEIQLLDMADRVNVVERAKECIKMQSEKLQTQNLNGGWISCSERMPEEHDAKLLKKLGVMKQSDKCLVTFVDFDVVNGKKEPYSGDRYVDEGFTQDGVFKQDLYLKNVTAVAWMPLPGAWKGE